jgi:hypothetical protein
MESKMNTEQFPIITSHITHAKSLERFGQQLAVVGTSLESGSISNPAYKDAKSIINRCIEDAFKDAINAKYTYHGKWESLSTQEYELTWEVKPQLHTILGNIKRIEKTKLDTPMVREMLAFLNEAKPLAEAFAKLKDMVTVRSPVTRVSPTDAMRQKYSAPSAAKSTQKMVIDVLTKAVDGSYEALVARIIERYMMMVDKYEALLDAAEDGKFPSPSAAFMTGARPNQEGFLVATMAFESPDHIRSGGRFFKTRPVRIANMEEKLNENARLLASEIRENFIFKNLVKIDSIIEAKNNLKEIEALSTSINMGVLKGDFRLKFEDGSSFMISNSVVWGTSKYGRVFQRFPLTFHDVVMPDGSKMAQPSEEKMNTIFVGKP